MVRPLVAGVLASFVWVGNSTTSAADGPSYTPAGLMNYPSDYRQWAYLTTGLDMSYTSAGDPNHHMFDNVFVNPSAYRSFLQTGTWPDKTVIVLEVRGAESKSSINQRGHTQSAEVMGVEVHVKDKALPGGWGFFGFDDKHTPAKMVDRSESCYSCHEMHAAVDTTFVQFYPTLLPIAKQKGTLSPEYLKEISAPAKN